MKLIRVSIPYSFRRYGIMYGSVVVEDDFDESEEGAMEVLRDQIRDRSANDLIDVDYDDDSDSDGNWEYCYDETDYQGLIQANFQANYIDPNNEPELQRAPSMLEDRFDSIRAPQWNSTDLFSKIGNDINKL